MPPLSSRESWKIIGISKILKGLCCWIPPTIANANDCELWEVAGDLTEKELEYRQKQFGNGGFSIADNFQPNKLKFFHNQINKNVKEKPTKTD